MPVYKANILNKEIIVNYEENQKEKLVEAISEINSKLTKFDNQNGKISDSILLSFLAIKLQAELIDLKKTKKEETTFEKKFNDTNNENINLNDRLHKLQEQNESIKRENNLINSELNSIQNQIDIIIKLIKNNYDV
tara:strand:- start:23 stop:430 length:408 start_codon:yes stop_codon:yes gene_type:complete